MSRLKIATWTLNQDVVNMYMYSVSVLMLKLTPPMLQPLKGSNIVSKEQYALYQLQGRTVGVEVWVMESNWRHSDVTRLMTPRRARKAIRGRRSGWGCDYWSADASGWKRHTNWWRHSSDNRVEGFEQNSEDRARDKQDYWVSGCGNDWNLEAFPGQNQRNVWKTYGIIYRT